MDGLITRGLRTSRGALALIAGAAAVLVVLVLMAIVLIRLGPQWLTDTEGLDPVPRDEARGRTRTALFAMLAGVIALIGATYTARTFALNRRGQITERFTRAIDQLGDDKMEIRLGGIYALERIAYESSDEHGPILEVLTAYVRENSPWPPRHPHATTEAAPAPQADHESEIQGTPQDDDTPPEASVDIKAILTVLSRRDRTHEHKAPVSLDLARTNLRGVQARKIDLRSANLAGAQLQEANLADAQLQGASLADAQLRRASLRDAQLQGATLADAQLLGARLAGAQLQEANLFAAQLRGAILIDAQLQGADLRGAHLQGASLAGAQLQEANLRFAQLRGADLRGVQARKIDLRSANLAGAQLQGADLAGAQLQKADLVNAQLQEADLSRASCNGETTWPDDFAWRDTGVQHEAE